MRAVSEVPRRSRPRRRLFRTLWILPLVWVFTGAGASTQNPLGECALTFDDPAALAAIPDQARYTFADGYRAKCVQHYVNVEPMTYGHFHLTFEDPTIDCVTGSGFGRQVGPDCVAADWDQEPRRLNSHVADHWIRIWMEHGSTHQPVPFDLRRIHVGLSTPIQLWFRTQNGTWWCWDELDDAETWVLEQWATNVVEVRIRGSASASGSFLIHNAYLKE